MTRWGMRAAVLAAFGVVMGGVTSHTQAPAPRPPVTKDQADRWMTELSNWGRWGKDDQLGALNLITQEKRRQAMALAKTGTVVSLERPVTLIPKPEESKVDNKPHGIHFYEIRFKTFPADDPRGNPGFSSDIQEFHVHGPMTHLDALCHDSDQGKLYNGYPLAETVRDDVGCTKLGLDQLTAGIVTRGVLVDLSRVTGAAARPPGAPIYPEDIAAWERATGITISAGDALFAYNPAPRGSAPGPSGGFDLSVLPLLKTRGVAVINGLRVIPEDRHADHRVPMVAMGIHMLDGVVLDDLATTARQLKRWEFMLVIAPLRVPGSTGSPVNPLAMF